MAPLKKTKIHFWLLSNKDTRAIAKVFGILEFANITRKITVSKLIYLLELQSNM